MTVARRRDDLTHSVRSLMTQPEGYYSSMRKRSISLQEGGHGSSVLQHSLVEHNAGGKRFDKRQQTTEDQHLLRFAHCAVAQTDNLHLLLCVVLLLVQFGDAANVTSHYIFFNVYIYIYSSA